VDINGSYSLLQCHLDRLQHETIVMNYTEVDCNNFLGQLYFTPRFSHYCPIFFYQKYESILSNNYEFNANINIFSLFVFERHIINYTCTPSKAS